MDDHEQHEYIEHILQYCMIKENMTDINMRIKITLMSFIYYLCSHLGPVVEDKN